MKVGVLGAGLMGREATRDLSNSPDVSEVGIANITRDAALAVQKLCASDNVKAYEVDATDEVALSNFMKEYDVVINALFYSFNERVAKTGIDVGTHVVDLGGHIGEVTDKVLTLHQEAKEAEVTIIPDLGVAPGMINILAGYGASKLDRVESIKMYVGGLPVRPEAPLGYKHVFSMEGVLDHYTDMSTIIRHGKIEKIASLSEAEKIYFQQFGPLEAFHTAGGTSTLLKTFSDVETLEYKTIRYVGHREIFQLFVDLGMTKRDYVVELDGQSVKPREVLLKVLEPFVQLEDQDDVVLLRVEVTGECQGNDIGYRYDMTTYRDRLHDITAMARATASTISIVAQMIGKKEIVEPGVFPPEQIVDGKSYIDALLERDILIDQTKINL